MVAENPHVLIIAGPNGAGKTTLTTLSGRGYLHHISQWQLAGYRVKLIFLQLASADEAIARVAQRVRQGGHDIPEAVPRAWQTLNACMRSVWMRGYCTTIRVSGQYCSTGAKDHERATDRSGTRA